MEQEPPFRLPYHVIHSIRMHQWNLGDSDNPTITGNLTLMGLVIFAYKMGS